LFRLTRSPDYGQMSTLSYAPHSKDDLQFQTFSLPPPILQAPSTPHHKSSATTSLSMSAVTVLPTFTMSPTPPYSLSGHTTTTTENWHPPPACTNFPTWTSGSKSSSTIPHTIPTYSLDGLINTDNAASCHLPIFHGGQDFSRHPGESHSSHQIYLQPHQIVVQECSNLQLLPVVKTSPSDCNLLPIAEEPSYRSCRGTCDLIYQEPTRPGTSFFQTTTLSNM